MSVKKEKLWRCHNCGARIRESKLGKKEYPSKMTGRIFIERVCPVCRSLDIYPTSKMYEQKLEREELWQY